MTVDWEVVDAEIALVVDAAHTAKTRRDYKRCCEDFDRVIDARVRAGLLPMDSDLGRQFLEWLAVMDEDAGRPPVSTVDVVRAALGWRHRKRSPEVANPLLRDLVAKAIAGYDERHGEAVVRADPIEWEDAVRITGPCPRPNRAQASALVATVLRRHGWSNARCEQWRRDPQVVAVGDSVAVVDRCGSVQLSCANHDLDWDACPRCLAGRAAGVKLLPAALCAARNEVLAVAGLNRSVLLWLRGRAVLCMQMEFGYMPTFLVSLGVDDVMVRDGDWTIGFSRHRAAGKRRVDVLRPRPDHPEMCGVNALGQWAVARRLLGTWQASSPLFGDSRPKLTERWIGPLTLQRALQLAQSDHDGPRFTAMSARRGLAGDLEAQGASRVELAVALGLSKLEHVDRYSTGLAGRAATGQLLSGAA